MLNQVSCKTSNCVQIVYSTRLVFQKKVWVDCALHIVWTQHIVQYKEGGKLNLVTRLGVLYFANKATELDQPMSSGS